MTTERQPETTPAEEIRQLRQEILKRVDWAGAEIIKIFFLALFVYVLYELLLSNTILEALWELLWLILVVVVYFKAIRPHIPRLSWVNRELHREQK